MSDITAIDLHPTDPNRRKDGRFLPGSAGSSGRPTRQRETAVLNALGSAISPDEVADVIVRMIQHGTSWRAQEAGVRLYMDYMVGTPIKRSVSASTKLDTLLGQISSMSEDEFRTVEAGLRNNE